MSLVVNDTEELRNLIQVGVVLWDVTGSLVVKTGPEMYACFCDLGAGMKWHHFEPVEMSDSPGGWFPMQVYDLDDPLGPALVAALQEGDDL